MHTIRSFLYWACVPLIDILHDTRHHLCRPPSAEFGKGSSERLRCGLGGSIIPHVFLVGGTPGERKLWSGQYRTITCETWRQQWHGVEVSEYLYHGSYFSHSRAQESNFRVGGSLIRTGRASSLVHADISFIMGISESAAAADKSISAFWVWEFTRTRARRKGGVADLYFIFLFVFSSGRGILGFLWFALSPRLGISSSLLIGTYIS
ncbi:hypothetical protein B0T24DRAFT_264999 [Lasiosphaeria ovina]|uniref:Uncharacterized protein n=1 Tax=Lasiosphaeria ovina TaxID=92902 RepID=A0AAE0N8M0_9PEZI|nr:hypothetical protein B0T24DRAFT_264999 [Lasiosphaeria ovina]